jgi:hypothetical protein
MNLDFRTMEPKMFMELFPALIPAEAIDQYVLLQSGKRISIPSPARVVEYLRSRLVDVPEIFLARGWI